MATKIEWTEATWNPIIGCSKISPGCENCYAEKMAGRLSNIVSTAHYLRVVEQNVSAPFVHRGLQIWNGQTHFVESALDKPLKRKKPTMYFVCSMGDLFHESVPFEWIDKVMAVIAQTPQHTFQILTKRADRMNKYFERSEYDFGYKITPNIWLGVTVENQEQADKRIPILLEIPAAIRFVSIEPMLGQIYLTDFENPFYNYIDKTENINSIDWVICGGETGTKARPMHPDWVRSLRDQCKETNTPLFFKSWGEYAPFTHEKGFEMVKVGKKKSGNLIDGKQYRDFPK